MVGSDHDMDAFSNGTAEAERDPASQIIGTCGCDEMRRRMALSLALDHIDIEMDDRSAQDIADLIVKAARVFEAYLDGTDRAAVPAKGN